MISPTPRRLLVSSVFAALVAAGVGCRTAPASHAEPAAAGSFAGSKPWLRTELYMAAAPPAEWQRFLSEVVTPRFPGGFTVLEAQGQWQAPTGEIRSLPSRLLVLLHPADAASEAGIESIRTAFKDRFHQVSVLRSTSAATVGF